MNRVTCDYRLKFTKVNKMRFIGHLDLLTYFQRAIKRANIPIAFSMGFNPHQLMSFTVPLPLGMASYAEYLDIRLDEEMPCEELKTRLNAQMSEGVEITDIRRIREKEGTGAALVAAADYTVELDFKDDNFGEKLKALEEEKEWNIEKLGKKKKPKLVDIRPMIYGLICENGEKATLHTRLATGSNSNLKVDLLLKYIYEKLGLEFDYLKIKVTRTEMYREENGEFIPLMK
ncbi:MAG: DUF2344 domain-containing protein [Firmicutes bacterium]|nr:DUF2344 domain-containing protein [Bacillota bacterium]